MVGRATPKYHHHGHQYSWTSSNDDKNTVMLTEWINPCGRTKPIEPDTQQGEPVEQIHLLRDSVQEFVVRLQSNEMSAIDVSDIDDWFKYNSTYEFLHQLDTTSDEIDLQKRHSETQIYVGAFQFLAYKQRKYDIWHNEGNSVTIEIQLLLVLAKTLLCDIETLIHSTGQSITTVLTRKQMDEILTFRNNNSIDKFNSEVDELDNKFAKVRFHEYVRNLIRILSGSGKRIF